MQNMHVIRLLQDVKADLESGKPIHQLTRRLDNEINKLIGLTRPLSRAQAERQALKQDSPEDSFPSGEERRARTRENQSAEQFGRGLSETTDCSGGPRLESPEAA